MILPQFLWPSIGLTALNGYYKHTCRASCPLVWTSFFSSIGFKDSIVPNIWLSASSLSMNSIYLERVRVMIYLPYQDAIHTAYEQSK